MAECGQRELPVVKEHGPGGRASLKPYLILIQPQAGSGTEQYWIDGRSKMAAMRHAARLAGVSPDRVIGAKRFRWSDEDFEHERKTISANAA